jgi:dihydrofolate reductase/thymidylate synthase
MRETFDMVVACDLSGGIGKNNGLPWSLPSDLKYFRQLTTSTPVPEVVNAVIMGRKTWESLPPQARPLKGRVNVVISRNPNYPMPEGHFVVGSIDQALDLLLTMPVDRVFVIGGAQIYNEALQNERLGLLYLTEIRANFQCDTFLPNYKPFFQLLSCSEVLHENNLDFVFKVYQYNVPEYLQAEYLQGQD